MFRSILHIVCVVIWLPAALHAQPVNVQINQGGYPEEVTIAVNPADPNTVIAGANLRYAFNSTDGGRTWKQSQLGPTTYGDPCVIFDADGRAYYAHLTVGWDAITVRTSTDGGATWSQGVKLFGPSSDSAKPGRLDQSSLQDKEWLAADLGSGPTRNYIYASWTDFTKYGSPDPRDSSVIAFARSRDRGESWDAYVRVSDTAGDAIDSDNTMEGAVPAPGPNGDVYVCWAGPRGLYFDRSFDAGVTWGTDKVLTSTPGGWDFPIRGLDRANGLPITLCDISNSVHRGTIYVNWVDERNGDPDVFIMRSTDRGDTWSAPLRVNDDPVGNGREQFFTWATVDQKTGELLVVYYDRRAYASDSTDVYLARSTDGGVTFSNQRISESPFMPTPDVFFGDYNCISAWNGRVRPIWTRLQDGVLSIHTALIDEQPSRIEQPASPEQGFLLDVFPNPVSSSATAETVFHVTLPSAAPVDLSMHDMVGRRVATITHGWLDAGEYTFPYKVSQLAAGQYACRLAVSARGTSLRAFSRVSVLTLLR